MSSHSAFRAFRFGGSEATERNLRPWESLSRTGTKRHPAEDGRRQSRAHQMPRCGSIWAYTRTTPTPVTSRRSSRSGSRPRESDREQAGWSDVEGPDVKCDVSAGVRRGRAAGTGRPHDSEDVIDPRTFPSTRRTRNSMTSSRRRCSRSIHRASDRRIHLHGRVR